MKEKEKKATKPTEKPEKPERKIVPLKSANVSPVRNSSQNRASAASPAKKEPIVKPLKHQQPVAPKPDQTAAKPASKVTSPKVERPSITQAVRLGSQQSSKPKPRGMDKPRSPELKPVREAENPRTAAEKSRSPGPKAAEKPKPFISSPAKAKV